MITDDDDVIKFIYKNIQELRHLALGCNKRKIAFD